MKQNSNKSIVIHFYQQVIGQRNPLLIDNFIGDQYVQHSPMLKDGKEGLREAINHLKKLPASDNTKSPIVCVLEDENYVIVQLDISFMGKRQSVIDLFRLENGKIVEHWDATQFIPKEVELDTPHFTHTENSDVTQQNKSFVADIFQGITDSNFAQLFSEKDKESPQNQFFEQLKTVEIQKVCRVLGEGNLVFVQAQGKQANKPFVFYYLLQIEHSIIKAHWSVAQEIPASMPHQNGMI